MHRAASGIARHLSPAQSKMLTLYEPGPVPAHQGRSNVTRSALAILGLIEPCNADGGTRGRRPRFRRPRAYRITELGRAVAAALVADRVPIVPEIGEELPVESVSREDRGLRCVPA